MRYLIGFLIVIGLIVLVFVLFLRGGSSTPKNPETNVTSYAATNTVVQLTINGPVTADQTHREVQITVGKSQATMNVIQGYEGTVLAHASYTNNENSYTVFLHALNLAGFTKTRKTSLTDDRGVCPLGNRNIYEIIDGTTDLQRTWNATCNGVGTYGGNTQTVVTLFQRQIPDYNKLTANVNLASISF